MFLILSLPRSRTAWLSHFLNYPLARPRKIVGHDILSACQDVEDFIGSYRNGMWGTVEPNGAPIWKIVKREVPTCRLIVVKRPLIEVYRSLTNKGVLVDLTELSEMNEMLSAAAADRDIATIDFKDLDSVGVCKWLFEYCLEIDFDFDWWEGLQALNVQVDLQQQISQMEKILPRRKKLMEEVRERSRGIECLN